MKNILIVILGPTGVGKTDLAIDIAAFFGSEIISADSRQFYREMKIGTAVPPDCHLKRINHHFIGFLSVKDYFSSSLYERAVIKLLPSLFHKNRIVIMTGGSGLYIDAVCKGIDDIPDIDPEIREKYNLKYKAEGIESLRRTLKVVDPDFYARVDLRNPKRIIRALEVFDSTGRRFSDFLTSKHVKRDFNIIKIGLRRERKDLYNRLNQRVDEMIGNGLEQEARSLFDLRHLNPLKSVGYRELFQYFEGSISREKAIELIKRNSRRYAKRQMTWWSRDEEITWYHPDQVNDILVYLKEKTEG